MRGNIFAITALHVHAAAGEVFTENVVVIGKRNLLIRTSRWRELPATGYRIDPNEHAELLATVRSSYSDAALSIGAIENGVLQISGFRFMNNTLRARSDYAIGVVLVPGTYADRRMLDYQFENNLVSYKRYSFILDSMGNA